MGCGVCIKNVKTAIGFWNKRDRFFHVSTTLFGPFLCRHDYDMNFPCFMEDVETRRPIFLSLSKLECGINKSIPGEFGHI